MNHISRILLAAALCGIGIAASAQEAKTFKTGKTYTPLSFAKSLGLNLDDYVSLNRNALPKKLRKALNK